MRHFRRYGLITFTLVALVYFLHWNWNLTMSSSLEFWRQAQKALKSNDEAAIAWALSDWCKAVPKAPEDYRYAAVLAEFAERRKKNAEAQMALKLMKNNVLAGR